MNAQKSSDSPFQHHSLKHRLIAWVSMNVFDGVTYTVGHGLLKGMKRRGGLGWVPNSLISAAQSPEDLFWRNLDLAGQIVYDVGSYHGLLALFFSSRAKHVVCFEPNSNNHKRLLENLSLNNRNNVTVRKVGLGSKEASMVMKGDPLLPGFSSVDSRTQEEINRSHAGAVTEVIQIVTLDKELPGLPAPDFIKVDIEGWELEALRGARQVLQSHKPRLFLEMHGQTMREKIEKVSAIVEFLFEMGYRNILHIESATAITPENSQVAAQGHLYCKPQ